MITCSSAKFGAKMERDSFLLSLSLQQQNFCEVPQLKRNSRSPQISQWYFPEGKLELVL
jgi:hypothetical protein